MSRISSMDSAVSAALSLGATLFYGRDIVGILSKEYSGVKSSRTSPGHMSKERRHAPELRKSPQKEREMSIIQCYI